MGAATEFLLMSGPISSQFAAGSPSPGWAALAGGRGGGEAGRAAAPAGPERDLC